MSTERGWNRSGGCTVPIWALGVLISTIFPVFSYGSLGPQDILVLVNANSHTSRYVASLYRQYYPTIADWQVLELTGLPDSSGPASTPADEIITRQQYETLIAAPVRDYLSANELETTIKVIITTAGMPYRIADTTYSGVVTPAASNSSQVAGNLFYIDAASVESELTCLWYTGDFGPTNRMVNPYQGYRQSSITLFERHTPGIKPMNWTTAMVTTGTPPKMEGQTQWEWPNICYGTMNRSFGPGDMYLTARLDGPKKQGQSAVFAVRRMLERAKRASSTSIGVNPAQAVIVIDDSPTINDTITRNRIYNLDGSVNYIVYDPNQNQPPNACRTLVRDNFTEAYKALTGGVWQTGILNAALSDVAAGMCVILDRRSAVRTSQSDLDALLDRTELQRQGQQGLAALACYGNFNGDEPVNKLYLLTGGPNGGPLYKPVNGAVFNALESFNAVTLFSDATTTQGKIVDFITIGGTGAIGHSFEPMSDSIVNNQFFLYNLFADEDHNGVADLTFVEAAWSAIPYVSWSEVVIGDPLMRVSYGQGQMAWEQFVGDVNMDNKVNIIDVTAVRLANGGILYSDDPAIRAKYRDMCDFNQDGRVNIIDVTTVRLYNGTSQ